MAKKFLAVGLIFVVGLAIGRFTLPAKVVEKEKIVYQDRTVENTEKSKNDHKTITKTEKVNPDGSKVIETKITDDKSTHTTDSKSEDISNTKEKETTTTNNQQSLIVSAIASLDVKSPLSINYGLSIQKRVLGPIYFGGFGLMDGTAGLSAGIAF